MRSAAMGVALTVLVAAVLWLAFGGEALMPAAVFGIAATGIQVVATTLMDRAAPGSFKSGVRGWAGGFGLRLLGVALMVVVIVARRDMFPPLPTAFGFLGVTIPLLFMEIRQAR